ncbi:hypothetical protein B4U79_18327 [Dinothrombium tinctorium]|uniref:Uncharacterized protein n=1 Tax=Dinothrombium tinctorium TaxID=1965070 RepID=A0A3S3NL98_9ACAR|nr:hypothetical protein B4U79_18543 [Dinothrombium tinctorium]RWS03609.1 hypothetical protein B4U79_18417 [Dinothrombium tinctorium]RWS05231.1 hypothetical protein B4U79_18327 [Dinothrombium tinctorium]
MERLSEEEEKFPMTLMDFRGDQFYQARGRRVESGPRPISSKFINVPNDLEAAFLYTKDDNKFIRYDFKGEELSVDDRFSSGLNFQPDELVCMAWYKKDQKIFLKC